MPFNGSGGFDPVAAPAFPAVAGTTIVAEYYNEVINDILTGLGQVITRDGQSPAQANLPMGGFKHTGAGDATANGQYLVYGQSTGMSIPTLRAGDGTALLPSISFLADTNTGMWRGGTDILAFSTAGAERLRMLADGKVGIGTVNPDQALVVNGKIAIAYDANQSAFGLQGANPTLEFYNTASTSSGTVLYRWLAGNGNSMMTLTHGASLSLFGRAAASANMDIRADVTAESRLAGGGVTPGSLSFDRRQTSSGVGQIRQRANSSIEFYTNDTFRMQITAAGVIQDDAGLELGYKGIPRVVFSGALTSAHRGKMVVTASGVTIPSGVFAAGDAVSIFGAGAGGTSVTITQGSSVSLRLAGTAETGNRTLAFRGMATIWFNDSNEAYISGAGVS